MFKLFENEYAEKKDLKIFMFCGDNIPNECLCGCGLKRLFTDEEQNKNYRKKNLHRFFQNTEHIKRFIKLTGKNNW
jgi:hypothetical protein